MREFFNDLLSTIFFFIVYSLVGDIFIATGVAIAVGVLQIVVMKLRRRPIDAMQWLSLALVIVLGGATLITQDGHFIMVKPSLVHFAIAAVMLRRGWMGRYLPPIARANLSEAMIIGWGYGWAALMIALGVTNLVVAFTFDQHTWAWFISVVAVAAKFALFAVQYAVFRTTVVRRMRLAAAQAIG